MKVYDSQTPILNQTGTSLNRKEKESGEFRKIMTEALGQGPERDKGPGRKNFVPPPGGIHMIQEANGIPYPAGGDEKVRIISAIEQTFDIVDFYARKLADSSTSIDSMSSLVSHLEERAEMLQDMGSEPGTPAPIKPILSDLALTIGKEVARFRRGDYS